MTSNNSLIQEKKEMFWYFLAVGFLGLWFLAFYPVHILAQKMEPSVYRQILAFVMGAILPIGIACYARYLYLKEKNKSIFDR